MARSLEVPRAARSVAVVGSGWAGIAAAVEATRAGANVTLMDMAAQPGGRARSVEARGVALDNGQHIMIGAYVDTLALMRTVGVDPAQAFLRAPLRFTDPQGAGLRLGAGRPIPAFVSAVLRQRGWSLRERLALLRAAAGWAARRFRCDPASTVAELTARLPTRVREQLIEPLCVAALNTAAADASGAVFLRVLRDALFSGPGSADLLLPREGLSDLLPNPAARWLIGAGAQLQLAHRVESIASFDGGWHVDGKRFDAVILATPPSQAAQLTAAAAPGWSRTAAGLAYEPIITVYLQCEGAQLPEAMLALHADDESPAQFVFDRGQLGGPHGLLAFVISGAGAWVDRGAAATARATGQQARAVLSHWLPKAPQLLQTIIEKRATFRCTPGLERPPMQIAPGLRAAGDYVAGPYPATLEGAVRSGLAAAREGAPAARPSGA